MDALTEKIPRCIGDLGERGGLSIADLADMAAVSEAIVSRWKAGAAQPSPDIRSVFSDLHSVVDRLGEYHEPRDVRAWLYAPHPQLDGARAIDRVGEGRSTLVLKILDRLDAGVAL